uniref:Uncharacterized protein n=1 Tax=Cacopsylla melanoneura TaxID=428564 RepID=A0A8D8WY45_9HEMI
MQLLNIALGIVIVLVYVNAESTAPEKPVELSISPVKAIDKTQLLPRYVVTKYFQVTGRIIRESSIKNRDRIEDLTKVNYREKFDADVTGYSGIRILDCRGIKYSYPFALFNIINEHPSEQEIKKIITNIAIGSNGTCFPVVGAHQN